MSDKKLKIGVLMGGPSAEHDVSLKTGRNVLKYLDKRKYVALPIFISREGKWSLPISQVKKNVDVLFLALHGEFGEDGRLQKILDESGISYTGSGARASRTGMDKTLSARVFVKNGLQVPLTIPWKDSKKSVSKIKDRLGFPFVVKPADRGSSVGVGLVNNERQIESALQNTAQFSRQVLFQEYVDGREFTCGVVEIDRKLQPLLPTEIISGEGSTFFDYRAKYTKGVSREITPPELPLSAIRKIQKMALIAHRAIGASGYSRTDMLMDKRGKMYALEINTLPGLTSTSLLPQEARAVGISFSELLDYIILAVKQ